MRARSDGKGPEEGETSREARVKIILLVVALCMVAAYAAVVANVRGTVGRYLTELGLSPAAFAGIALAALLVGGGILVFRRRSPDSADGGAIAETEDALARLPGRKAFLETLAAQYDKHAVAGRQLALHVVDIDRFRAVNEALGAEQGDALLRGVAERLLALAGHPDRVGRIGDDEFAAIQPEAGGTRHAEIYAQRIQEALKAAYAEMSGQVKPGGSVGVAVAPDHGTDSVRLLHSASLALRAAKQAGGDCFRVFSRDMEMAVEASLQMEKAIGDGLHQGWFELHFQPQYDLASRRLTGFEALVRMNHPERGELHPSAFLAIAEERGLMQPLGEWILREALATAALWPAHLRLSVNVWTAQFRHGDMAASIFAALEEAGVDADRLTVEIPEEVLLSSSDSVQAQLRRLKEGGAMIVVDDFGLNSSNLQSLARSLCDAVKLDRSFVQRVGTHPEIGNLLRSLIGTARSFELDVMAEGIERAEQAHFLLANGCRHVQGFLFGRPAHVGDLAAIIAKDVRNSLAEGERGRAAVEPPAEMQRQA